MKLITPFLLLSAASAFSPSTVGRANPALSMSESTADAPADSSAMNDLKSLAVDLNPAVKYFDPLNLVDADIYNMGQDATIGFLRHAEIKHGRVAMAAFVGYCVQSNWHFPWNMSLDGSPFPSVELSPEMQWDAIPANAKWQIILLVGALEIWDESSGGDENATHYMKGRQAGKYPSFQIFRDNIHWVLDLYDPFGFSKNMSQEKKDKRLAMEINNGRLAMLGIFGFLSADTVEGSVPLLSKIAIPYDGQVMSPFEAGY